MGANMDIVIVGAGIAGLSAAVGLATRFPHNCTFTVLEKHPSLQTLGGRVAVDSQAIRVLDEWGMLSDIEKTFGTRSDRILSHRRWNGEEICELSWGKESRKVFGYEPIAGRRSDLQKVLYNTAIARGVTVRFGCKIIEVDQDTPSITLEGGEVVRGDLIIAADGIRSVIRGILSPGDHERYSGLDDYLVDVPVEVLKNDPELSELYGRTVFWWGPKGCVVNGVAGPPGRERYFMEWAYFSDSSATREFDAVPVQEILKNFQSWDPKLGKLLEQVNDAYVWRLSSLSSDLRWVSESGKVAMVGDAAHAMLPHTGSGATTGIEDGSAMAECLARAKDRSDIPKCLRAFEMIRKPRLKYIQDFGLEQVATMHIPDGPEQEARDKWMAEVFPKMPNVWDGKPIDEPPYERRELRRAYMAGHNVKEFTNRMLDEMFST